jgi:hypothetical protein
MESNHAWETLRVKCLVYRQIVKMFFDTVHVLSL